MRANARADLPARAAEAAPEQLTSSATVPAMFTSDVESGMPQVPKR